MIHVSRKLALSCTYLYTYNSTGSLFLWSVRNTLYVSRELYTSKISKPTQIRRTRKNTNAALISPRAAYARYKIVFLDPLWAHRSHDRTITYNIKHYHYYCYSRITMKKLRGEKSRTGRFERRCYICKRIRTRSIHTQRGFVISMIIYHTKITKRVVRRKT